MFPKQEDSVTFLMPSLRHKYRGHHGSEFQRGRLGASQSTAPGPWQEAGWAAKSTQNTAAESPPAWELSFLFQHTCFSQVQNNCWGVGAAAPVLVSKGKATCRKLRNYYFKCAAVERFHMFSSQPASLYLWIYLFPSEHFLNENSERF